MKLSRFLTSSRSTLVGRLLTEKASSTTNALWAQHFSSQAVSASKTSHTAQYTVFKGKAALSVKPSVPTFNNSNDNLKYANKGCVFMTFWPAIGERKYQWEKRQIFALSPTEVGAIIGLEPGQSCEFFHDPSIKSSAAGQVRKSLAVTPLGDDKGYFFSLNVVNNIQKTNERLSVPVTKAEYTVMRTAFSYILPHIMGWDLVTKQQVPSTRDWNPPVRQQEIRLTPNLEWDR